MSESGLNFLTSSSWDANRSQFGILPQIWGTLYSSFLALVLGGFFGVVIAIFLTQDFLPPSLQVIFKNIIELLAAIPSVVYGLWGIFVLIPLIRPYCEWLYTKLSWIPFFSTSLAGPGMLPAALVSRHNDFADGRGDLAGFVDCHSLQSERSRLRHGNHPLAGNYQSHAPHRLARHFRSPGARTGKGPRRDHGSGHAGW